MIDKHVVLKGMYHLMSEHMIGLRPCFGERKDDPIFERFGYAARTHTHRTANGDGLLKIGMIAVGQYGILLAKRIAKHAPMPLKPHLGTLRQLVQQTVVGQIVVDVEMGRFVNLESYVLVYRLITPKILSPRTPRPHHGHRYERGTNKGYGTAEHGLA